MQGASGSASSPDLAERIDAVAGQAPLYLSESRVADASSVGWARKAVAELAVAAGMQGERVEDVRLAVSEAVTNSVAYAYEGAPGKVHIIAAVVSGELWIVVADDGMGMRRRPSEIRGLGLGLGLMARVSDALTILARSSGGVEVQMRFQLGEHPDTGS
ncbi:MAG: ATP-binding protein [Solirubrobacteraceae bacterium]|jgi:stage II sporulation protein AB (anti-sigma F factor)